MFFLFKKNTIEQLKQINKTQKKTTVKIQFWPLGNFNFNTIIIESQSNKPANIQNNSNQNIFEKKNKNTNNLLKYHKNEREEGNFIMPKLLQDD